jgi:hypothetical protein
MKAIYSRKNKKQTALVQCMLLFLLLKISETITINEIISQNRVSAKVAVNYSGSKEDE